MFQIPNRGSDYEKFLLDCLVNLKFRMGFEIFPYSCLWAVTGPPWTFGKQFLWHGFNYGVENYAVTALACHRCVGFEFRLDVVANVIADELPI